jgi:hypothetical protein
VVPQQIEERRARRLLSHHVDDRVLLGLCEVDEGGTEGLLAGGLEQRQPLPVAVPQIDVRQAGGERVVGHFRDLAGAEQAHGPGERLHSREWDEIDEENGAGAAFAGRV